MQEDTDLIRFRFLGRQWIDVHFEKPIASLGSPPILMSPEETAKVRALVESNLLPSIEVGRFWNWRHDLRTSQTDVEEREQ